MPSDSHPKVHITTPSGTASVDVEVVSSEEDVERGLMYRKSMAPDAGMLFLMRRDYDWAFWMKNTYISLDLIFIRRDMTIAGIVKNAPPLNEDLQRVGEPSLYVLEVNAGWTAQHGVVANAKVWFDGVSTR